MRVPSGAPAIHATDLPAQLVTCGDSFHLSSPPYDCQLQEIFVTHDSVAGCVSKVPLSALNFGETARPLTLAHHDVNNKDLRAGAPIRSPRSITDSRPDTDPPRQKPAFDPNFTPARPSLPLLLP